MKDKYGDVFLSSVCTLPAEGTGVLVFQFQIYFFIM